MEVEHVVRQQISVHVEHIVVHDRVVVQRRQHDIMQQHEQVVKR